MWLRDSLTYDMPDARIFIYGYDSKLVGSQSKQRIQDLAIKFRVALQGIRRSQPRRPLLLIGHSLGGIILKKVTYG